MRGVAEIRDQLKTPNGTVRIHGVLDKLSIVSSAGASLSKHGGVKSYEYGFPRRKYTVV